jgi:hypothetical protein
LNDVAVLLDKFSQVAHYETNFAIATAVSCVLAVTFQKITPQKKLVTSSTVDKLTRILLVQFLSSTSHPKNQAKQLFDILAPKGIR